VSILKLGYRLKDIWIKTGLSQKAFAERIGSTQQNIGNYANGLTEPSLEVLRGKSACIEQVMLNIVVYGDQKQLSKKILQTILNNES
jgi:transcriptional regulator with XRE-family HTH domain